MNANIDTGFKISWTQTEIKLPQSFFGYANIFTSIVKFEYFTAMTGTSLCYFQISVCAVDVLPTMGPSSSDTRISAPISPKSRGWKMSHAHPTTSSTRALRKTDRTLQYA